MKHNAIILTSGLTGSSVLTGLIARGGFWTGSTHKKSGEYDTYENTRLIELNRSLFAAAGYSGNYMTEFSPALLRDVASLAGTIDESRYRAFLAECDGHAPWVWKDPRLWVTIGFWEKLLDIERCRFILLKRSLLQCWVSGLLRRQIRSYGNSRAYELAVQKTIGEFLRRANAQFIELRYEDLILKPEESIGRLNRFLDAKLTTADLQSVYHKPLYKSPNGSAWDAVKAALIYAKNYSERVDRTMRGAESR